MGYYDCRINLDLAVRGAIAFFIYSNFINMPSPMKLEVSRSIVSSTSTLPANDKAVLVSVRNHQVVTTSLRVAEYFGKEHSKVLRSISTLECSALFRNANFGLSCYTKKNGNVSKSYPMYYLTRDGFTLLAMGFTGKIAARFKEAYIEAFNEMERTLRESESTECAKAILKERIAEFNKRMKEGVAEGRKRHGDGYGGRGDMMPWLPFYERMSFEENIRNILAFVSCSYADSMFFISQLDQREEELDETRKFLRKLSGEIYQRIGY